MEKIRKWLSAGRVQSVAVKLIVEKEIEIRNFKPVESWKFSCVAEAEWKKFKVILHKINSKVAKLKTKQDAEKIFKEVLWDIELKESQDKKWNTILEAKKQFNLVLKEAVKKESKNIQLLLLQLQHFNKKRVENLVIHWRKLWW